jgi:hypothetical protein
VLEPDGSAYFYTVVRQNFGCSHSFLYVVWHWNERTPAFCGLCFLWNLFRDEAPSSIHEYKQLAENGNPAMKASFLKFLESQMGLVGPSPGQSLKNYRLARGQLSRKPSKASSPATFALWELFGSQPKMAKPLLRLLLGVEESDVSRQLEMSLYNLQTTVAKGIRTSLRYVR